MRSGRIVGRAAELAALRCHIDEIGRGAGSALFLLGEAGIGKSRLVGETVQIARDAGMTVLQGRAVQSPNPAPFRPLSEALLGGERALVLPDELKLAGLGPALAVVMPHWAEPDADTSGMSLVMVSEALLRFLQLVGGDAGCLLVMEDMQWADTETLAVLEYLADNSGDTRVGCVASLRPDTSSQALAIATGLAQRRRSELLDVPPLAREQVAQLITCCLGDVPVPAAVAEFVCDRSDGVPFHAEELLSGLMTDGALQRTPDGWRAVSRLVPRVPLTVAESVQRRIQHSAVLGQVLPAAATLGRGFDAALLPRITALSDGDVAEALWAARAAGLIEIDGGRHRFRHALTHDAVLAAIPAGSARELAARAATAVETADPALAGAACLLAANLRRNAGHHQRAAELLAEAARRARRGAALETAEGLLRDALTLDDVDVDTAADLHLDLVRTLVAAGKTDAATQLGDDLAHRLALLAPASARQADLELELSKSALTAGDWDGAERRSRTACDAASAAGADDKALAAEAVRAHALMGRGADADAVRLAERTLSRAKQPGTGAVACECLEIIGRATRAANPEAAEESFHRALAIAERDGLSLHRLRALHEIATIDLVRPGRTDRILRARDAAVRAGALANLAVIDLHLVVVHTIFDRWADAVDATERSVALSRKLGLATLPAALTHSASAHALAGDRAAMLAAIDEAERDFGDHPDVRIGIPRSRALYAFREAQDDAAREHLDDAMTAAHSTPASNFPFSGLWALLHTVHDVDGETARDEVRTSGLLGIFPVRVDLAAADIVVAARRGESDCATSVTELIDEMKLRVGGSWVHHLVRIVASAALRDGWGEPIRWLTDARTYFENHGFDRAADWCRDQLRQAGIRTRRPLARDAQVPEPLRRIGVTSREHDVLTQLLQGMSNQQIAKELFCSPRTVEKHVASLLRKTGCATRTELAARAAASSF